MSNPISAIFNVVTVVSDVLSVGVEGSAAYLQLWKKNQVIEHRYAHKTFSLESLAEYGKRASKAKETIASIDPEIIAFLES